MNSTVSEDPDHAEIDIRFPGAMKIGSPFSMTTGPMKGDGHCIRRKLTPRGGILFTIRYSDDTIREWEWFD